MNKTYIYRKHLRTSFKGMLAGLGIIESIIFIMFMGLILTNKDELNLPLILFITVIITIILLVEIILIYFILIRRFKFINVTLTENSIVYNNNKKQIIIPYDDIVKIKFPSVKYTGRWVKIIYKDGSIRLTAVLENIGDFIYELKKILDQKEKNNVYKEKKMFNFFKTASFSDESWERLYDNIKLQLITHYLSIVMTIIILLVFNDGSRNNEYLVLRSLFIPIIGYEISEIILCNKMRKRIINGEFKLQPRNRDFEKKINRITILYFTIGYIVIFTLFKAFG